MSISDRIRYSTYSTDDSEETVYSRDSVFEIANSILSLQSIAYPYHEQFSARKWLESRPWRVKRLTWNGCCGILSKKPIFGKPILWGRTKWLIQSHSPLQREVIIAVIEGHDVFLQASTSFGKSLCYQLPAVLKDWGSESVSWSEQYMNTTDGNPVTVVVCPLLSLMVSIRNSCL